MSIKEINRTIAWIDQEIREQQTGTPDQLAGKLKMSVRLLYYYLDMMKLLGAPIEYSQSNNTFVYLRSGYFYQGYKWIEDNQEVPESAKRQI